MHWGLNALPDLSFVLSLTIPYLCLLLHERPDRSCALITRCESQSICRIIRSRFLFIRCIDLFLFGMAPGSISISSLSLLVLCLYYVPRGVQCLVLALVPVAGDGDVPSTLAGVLPFVHCAVVDRCNI